MGLGRVLLRNGDGGGNGSSGPPALGWWGGGHSVLPTPVSEESAQGLAPFWRGLAYVSGTVAMLPAMAYRGTEQINPQPAVLSQPDPRSTALTYWAEVVRSLVLYGNSVSLVADTDRLGYPTALRAVHPLDVSVRFTGNPAEPDISEWYVMGHEVDPSAVWHVRSYIGRTGWPLGLGLIAGAAEGLSLAQALQDYAAGYFAGGALPSVALKVNRPELTAGEADQVRNDYISRFGGTDRRPAVLNSLTDIQPIAANPTDSQLIECRALSVSDVALLFGIPPSKLGAASAGMTYRNAEQEEIQARNDAIAPWARLLEQAATLELLPRGQRCVWDLDAYLRADTLTRYQAHQIALGGPGTAWETVDEVRDAEGLDPMADELAGDPEGDALAEVDDNTTAGANTETASAGAL